MKPHNIFMMVMVVLSTITLPAYYVIGDRVSDGDGFLYLESMDASYKLIHEKYHFLMSVLKCQSLGGMIWIPNTPQEVRDVMKLFEKEEFEEAWVGFIPHEGNYPCKLNGIDDFVDRNEREKLLDHITEGMTINKNGSPPVLYTFNDHYGFFINYKNSTDVESAICVKREENIQYSNEFDNYTYLEDFKAGYKYHPKEELLGAANAICLLEGATVWVPESTKELEAVIDTIILNKTDPVLIGIHNYSGNGFTSIDGKSDFTSWLINLPKDNLVKEISIYRDASYVKFPTVSPFVCKKYNRTNLSKLDSTEDFWYNRQMDALFRVHLKRESFFEAGRVCDSENGSMVMDNVQNLKIILKSIKMDIGDFWIGFRKLEGNQYIRTDGEEIYVYEKSMKKYGCGLYQNGNISIKPCDTKMAFMCKINGNNEEFIYSSLVSVWYLFSPYALTWHDAVSYCTRRNATIVTLKREQESGAIIEMMSSKMGAYTFIGYFKNDDMNHTAPLKGFDMNAFNNLKWENEPDSMKRFCVALTKAGRVAALDCNRRQHFICQK